MQIEKIYFDMDGVLVDFDKGIRELGNFDCLDQNKSTKEQDEALWNAVRSVDDFYDRLDPIPGAIEMFNAIYAVYGDKCEILSAVPKPHRNIPNARENKTSWVRRNLSDDVVINLVYRSEKQDYVSGKGCILIDDFSMNIEEWNASGGTGILFKDTKSVLRDLNRIAEM